MSYLKFVIFVINRDKFVTNKYDQHHPLGVGMMEPFLHGYTGRVVVVLLLKNKSSTTTIDKMSFMQFLHIVDAAATEKNS